MKKNLRIVSAAAAALLAVAPIAATAVPVNAAKTEVTQGTVYVPTSQTGSQVGNTITLGSNMTVKNNQKVSDLTTETAVKNALHLPSGVNIAGFGAHISITTGVNTGSAVTSLSVGRNSAYVNASITLSGLKRNTQYHINGKTMTTNQDGVTPSFVVSIPVTVFDANSNAKPYFVNSKSLVQVPENGTVDQTITITKGERVSKIVDDAKATVTLSPDSTLLTDANAIVKALQAEGVSFNSANTVEDSTVNYVPANKALSIKLTAQNNNSGNETSVTVNANTADESYKAYPVIFYRKTTNIAWSASTAVKQGNKVWNNAPTIVIDQSNGGQFKPTDYFKASINGDENAWTNDFTVNANDVDVTKAGLYHVTVSAKNNAGLTTTLTVPVVVTDASGKIETIKYQPGYPVTVYSVLNGSVVKSSNNYNNLYNGTPVKVFETKTIGGKEYTRIQTISGTNSNDTNAWVEADKLSGYKAPTEASKSTKIMYKSAIYSKAKDKDSVSNTGKTIAGYTDADLVVDNNGNLKVYTINGETFYKIANENGYVRARNVTGSKMTLKKNSYVYKSNGKRASKKLLKKGSTITVYGGQYKAIRRYHKKAVRVGVNRYVKVVNVNYELTK